MDSEAPVGTFKVEDSFTITGRGLVLAGQLLKGKVNPGNYLVFSNSTRLKIRAVDFLRRTKPPDSYGLLVDAPAASRQELVARGIIGGTALIITQ